MRRKGKKLTSKFPDILAFELLGVGSTYLGPTAQATTAIYSGVLAMCYPVPYAISLAAAIRVGNSIGAGQASQAKQAAGAAQKIALLVVLSAAGCLGIFHRQVATFYTNDNHVAQMFTANVSRMLR